MFLHEKRVESLLDFLFSVQQHSHRFIVLYTNLAAVTSCKNDLNAPDTLVIGSLSNKDSKEAIG